MVASIEEWKDIPGYEGYYRCSNLGRFLHVPNNRILKTGSAKGGWYPSVHLSKKGKAKSFNVHRILMILFKDNPNNYPQVNHINGIKTDNRLENLEWCSVSENRKHALRTGLSVHLRGLRPYSKLDEIQVKTIKRCLADGMESRTLSKYFKVNESVICSIRIGRTWVGV